MGLAEGPRALKAERLHVGGLDEKLEFISGQIAEFVRRNPYRSEVGVNLDTNGNGSGILFECREFTTFKLHRVVLQTLAHGPGNPFASTSAWVGLYRNQVQPGNLIDFIPAGQTIFPSEFVPPSDDGAEVLEPNSTIWLSVNNGPPNDLVIARVQGMHHADWRMVAGLAMDPMVWPSGDQT